ncbi:hypothetical protein MKW92_037711, partial [Papaver armeniacum]
SQKKAATRRFQDPKQKALANPWVLEIRANLILCRPTELPTQTHVLPTPYHW